MTNITLSAQLYGLAKKTSWLTSKFYTLPRNSFNSFFNLNILGEDENNDGNHDMDEYIGKYKVFFNIFVSLRKFDTVLRNMDPTVKIAWVQICQTWNNLN